MATIDWGVSRDLPRRGRILLTNFAIISWKRSLISATGGLLRFSIRALTSFLSFCTSSHLPRTCTTAHATVITLPRAQTSTSDGVYPRRVRCFGPLLCLFRLIRASFYKYPIFRSTPDRFSLPLPILKDKIYLLTNYAGLVRTFISVWKNITFNLI